VEGEKSVGGGKAKAPKMLRDPFISRKAVVKREKKGNRFVNDQ